MLHLLVDYSPKTKSRARGLPGQAMTNFKSPNVKLMTNKEMAKKLLGQLDFKHWNFEL
jgi:hypothetical protein